MAGADTARRPLRADAERNRARIIEAAREVFAERGLHASLDDVADRAGVGVGTVYRRFADKNELIDAIFEDKIAEVAEHAQKALEHEDPWEGFVSFFSAISAEQATNRGLKEALLTEDEGRARVARARAKIEPVVTELVERAKDSGRLRPDFDPLDVPLLHKMIGDLADSTRTGGPDYWRRALQIVIDGLAASRDTPTPLPAPPMERERFETAMARDRR